MAAMGAHSVRAALLVVLGAAACHLASGRLQPGDKTASVKRVQSQVVPTAGCGAQNSGIAAGSTYSCALVEGGALKCWGGNGSGQLGLGNNSNRGVDEMGANLPMVDLGKGAKVVAVAAGDYHACALLEGGAIKCWGDNFHGQLGQEDNQERNSPADLDPIDLGPGARVAAVDAGSYHTCALLSGGTVKCWGYNYCGQLGVEEGDVPQSSYWRGRYPGDMGARLPAVDLGRGKLAVAVAAGGEHTCALLQDGSVKCWGDNLYGQLGLGDEESRGTGALAELGDQLPAVDLGVQEGAVAISAGGHHTCALLEGGLVKCWGQNVYGQLGLGDHEDRGTLLQDMGARLPAIDLGSNAKATAVSAGGRHTCALLEGGSVVCWGSNTAGQLGVASTASAGDDVRDARHIGDQSSEMGAALQRVGLGPGAVAVAISAGDDHTCALLAGGKVVCWGGNIVDEDEQEEEDGNEDGERADEVMEPVVVDMGAKAVQASAGSCLDV